MRRAAINKNYPPFDDQAEEKTVSMFPKKVLVVVSLIAASCLPGAAWSLPYSSLYVFGDSLADSGNNAVFFDFNGTISGEFI